MQLRARAEDLNVRCNVIDLLLCTGMYYSLACLFFFWLPTTQWISWSTLLQTAHGSGPVLLVASCSSRHQEMHVLAHAVNTALSCPQAQHSAALIEFQTQSMLQGNCIVNQCLSEPRQWSGLHSPFLQIGYEGYTVV